MATSISPRLEASWEPSEADKQLNGKVIAVILVAMRHRDFVYKTAHALGAKLVFVDSEMQDWAQPYAHDFIQVTDPYTTTTLIPALEGYITKQRELNGNPEWKFDGIISFDEFSIVSTSELCVHFNAIGIPPPTLSRVKHKYLFRSDTRIVCPYAPKAILLPLEQFIRGDYIEEFKKWTFPIVLKPVGGASSGFVRQINSYDELNTYVTEYYHESTRSGATKNWFVGDLKTANHKNFIQNETTIISQEESTPTIDTNTNQSLLPQVDQELLDSAIFMAEEFMYGNEVDIDLVVEAGVVKFIALADNFPAQGGPGLFMESGGCQPSQLPQKDHDAFFDMTKKIISLYGSDLTGVFHFEAKMTPNGPCPIEMNLRLGGCEVLGFNLAVYGVNLGIQALKLACGIPIETLNIEPRAVCCSTNILAVDSGYVVDVGFDEKLDSSPFYQAGMHRCWVGQALKAPPLGFQFCAWMVTSGKDFIEAKKNIDLASNSFYIHFKPFTKDDPNGRVCGQGYYLEGSERANWSLIKQSGHSIESFELKSE